MAAQPHRGHPNVIAHVIMNQVVNDTTQSSQLDILRRDLDDEQRSLDDVVSDISCEQWLLATASPGWNVADQIGHLTYFDASATSAISDPEEFRTGVVELYEGAATMGIDQYTLGRFRELSAPEKLNSWRHNRRTLLAAAHSLHDGDRIAWYGPSMGAASFLTARLMETWAHGTDVVDALGAERASTDRLRHIARLGFMTRNWSYAVRGEQPPAGEMFVELTGPAGESWTWGNENADDTVRGSAQEFCLVVTQRRHVDDTSLVTSDLGREWLLRAQAFAGAASDGPRARSV
jgi:uncharacterized protein (TIGR03084 family)